VLKRRILGGSGTCSCDEIAVDHADNIYVSGTFTGELRNGAARVVALGETDAFLAKARLDGMSSWLLRYGSSEVDRSGGLTVDPGSAAVFVGGTVRSTVSLQRAGSLPLSLFTSRGESDGILMRFNRDAVLQWSKQIGGSGPDYIQAISYDEGPRLWITGAFSGTPGAMTSDFGDVLFSFEGGHTDAFVAEYAASDGRHLWSEGLGTATEEPGFMVIGTATDRGRSIATRSDVIAVAGSFFGQTRFGGGPPTMSHGNSDGFVATYRP
jgi:hypothetical protein